MKEEYVEYIRNTIIGKIMSTNDIRFLQIVYDLLIRNASE